jgi:hypothetical protein
MLTLLVAMILLFLYVLHLIFFFLDLDLTSF